MRSMVYARARYVETALSSSSRWGSQFSRIENGISRERESNTKQKNSRDVGTNLIRISYYKINSNY